MALIRRGLLPSRLPDKEPGEDSNRPPSAGLSFELEAQSKAFIKISGTISILTA